MNTQNPDYRHLHRETLLHLVYAMLEAPDFAAMKEKARLLGETLSDLNGDSASPDGDTIRVKTEPLRREIQQILDAYTHRRACYYARRLLRGLCEVKTNKVNDINLRRWKDYDEVLTDSLWTFDRRDQSGAHLGWYWGNFVPQIPRQLMLRYSKQGDLVVDPFLGSGTTLIECRRLGRHGGGVEIDAETVRKAHTLVEAQENPHGVKTVVETGDSRFYDFREMTDRFGRDAVDLFIMHPPYHDIIRFTSDPRDLSNAETTGAFLQMFGRVLDNTIPLLRPKRYVGIVIGDKYSRGEWIPLGFYCMQEAMAHGLRLKSIVVKNFEETKGKRNQKQLWRYRALVGGFYVFKHEYILIMEKP